MDPHVSVRNQPVGFDIKVGIYSSLPKARRVDDQDDLRADLSAGQLALQVRQRSGGLKLTMVKFLEISSVSCGDARSIWPRPSKRKPLEGPLNRRTRDRRRRRNDDAAAVPSALGAMPSDQHDGSADHR